MLQVPQPGVALWYCRIIAQCTVSCVWGGSAAGKSAQQAITALVRLQACVLCFLSPRASVRCSKHSTASKRGCGYTPYKAGRMWRRCTPPLPGQSPSAPLVTPKPNHVDARLDDFPNLLFLYCLSLRRLQQIRSSWQEHPNNNNAVMRLTPECRDLLDKMFDTNQVGWWVGGTSLALGMARRAAHVTPCKPGTMDTVLTRGIATGGCAGISSKQCQLGSLSVVRCVHNVRCVAQHPVRACTHAGMSNTPRASNDISGVLT